MKKARHLPSGNHRPLKRLPATRVRAALSCAAALLLCIAVPTAGAQQKEPGTVSLQVIVVDSQAKAQTALQRLKAGEDFSTVAKAMSIDPNAANSGYVGDANPALLRPELRQALDSMKPGEISAAIKLSTGYVILKLLGRTLPAGGQGEASPPQVTQESAPGQGMGPNRDLLTGGKNIIQYPADVAGQVLADMLFQKFPKPSGWEQDLQEVCEIRKQSLAEGIEALQKLAIDPAQMAAKTPFDAIQAHYGLAQLEAYRGDMNAAVKEWESAYKLAAAGVPAGIPQLTEVLGVAYLHKAEMENGAYTNPGDRCLFPPLKSSCYVRTGDSQKAIEYLTKYLQLEPERPDVVQVKWLLNLAYLTLGKYPAGVPRQYLIAPSVFASKQNVGRFRDVSRAAGLGFVSMAGGVVADDFENDGLLDVVVSSYDVCQPLRFFHNKGDGTFTDRTAAAGLSGQLGGLNMIQADYNNDGCMDLLVLRGAWEFPERKSLLRNNCDGTFTDVTRLAGLAEPATRTQTAVWADINNDGLLDLFVGNENGLSQLFLNKGDGTFQDISKSSGMDKVAFTKGVTAADYDNDGYVDFYVSNLYGGNFLYHNNRNNTFTDVSHQAGVHQPQSQSFATWFFDYDNDGWPDLFVTSYFFSVDETIRSYLGLPTNAGTFKLYRNLGNGTFKDVTSEVGLNKINVPMGANFGDIDNDGWFDIYLATGGPEYGAMVPKMLLRNVDGKRFADITASSGTGDLHKGHAASFADLGNNGNEDLLVSIGGATPGDAHQFRVFANPGNGNDWITLKLVGVRSNRAGIGARIHVTVQNGDLPVRSIYRTVNSGGSFGANPIEQHIGLGKSAKILRLEVFWPVSKSRQDFADVQNNQFIEITEFAKNYKRLHRRSFQLGRKHP
ncbi:MAG TPA: FG-GAP-like repeat-containing protein [Candidatus Acidoferrales bacterium]|nr:FG-GAP-like repeat-containing protein [Candidatus Acidoferrales bacterium]